MNLTSSPMKNYWNILKIYKKISFRKKTSDNSSIAPSTDINKTKKNQSLRQKSGKKPGAQPGHEAKTLHQSDKPNEIIAIPFTIEHCKKCDSTLADTFESLKEKRQVLDIDLQRIDTQIREYQSFSKVCPICGYENHDKNYRGSVATYTFYTSKLYNIHIQLTTSSSFNYMTIWHTINLSSIILPQYKKSIGAKDETYIKRASWRT